MKRSNHVRFVISLFLLTSLLTPLSVLAFDNSKKYFSEGMKHESAEEWDKAVEQFALAVADSPKNPEYRLHLTRALFNASQQFMKKGTAAAKEKDYETGYLAFRKAYAFDPTNELAKSEMERMVRLQQEINEGPADPKNPKKDDPGKVKLVLTSNSQPVAPGVGQVPQKLEKLRDLPFPSGIPTQFIIKELARDLDLNVLFDKESFRAADVKTYIDLKNVTAARALDYIFLQEGLFFQKVGPRTIIVANQAQRQKFQQLVLRTFYLANAAPKDVVKVVQTAIPAQPGRSQTIVLQDEATNSVTIRDTAENIRLIGQLIKSLDKDRAEVVMDVAIYEVNKNDLLQFGNQVGTQTQLTTLGGSQSGQVRIGNQGLFGTATASAAATVLSSVIPTGFILPSSNLTAFQSKNDTKLLAFSQIHAFNNEDSSARIGQRVPVQSAQFLGVGTTTGGVNNNGLGQTANVINYEQVGLTLKFKPIVFPNQDVQVAMEIESKDVSGAGGFTPTFTERTIKGTARIQNNKTLLLASVAQGVESKGKQGLPLLGLIPIIGRLFTAPTRDNRQVDIVIAVTPRVIRAPAILPEDEIERDTGSLAVPTTNTLQEMIVQEDRDELLAAARRLPNASAVQLPDQAAPEYVKADAVDVSKTAITESDTTTAEALQSAIPNLKPIDTSSKPLELTRTSDVVKTPAPVDVPNRTLEIKEKPDNDKPSEPGESKSVRAETVEPTASAIELRLGAELTEMKRGDKLKIPVLMQGSGMFRTATMGLKFDPSRVAVRSVSYGDAFTGLANTVANPFLNDRGKLFVTFTAVDDKGLVPAGTLAFVEIEALVAGKPQIDFDRDMFYFQTSQGKNLAVKLQ